MGKMVALRTIAIVVFSAVAVFFNGPVKQVAGFFDLIPNLGQVDETEGGAVFLNQVFEGDPVKGQVMVIEVEAFLGEIIGLIDKIKIGVFH
jgi:hypothetical protein